MGDYGTLTVAAVVFVASHMMMASTRFKVPVSGRIGRGGFLALYVVVSLAAFAWMIHAYLNAPVAYLWIAPTWVRHLPMGVMLFACILIVAGYTAPNPSAVGLDRIARIADGPRGIFRVARQPILAAIALWSLVHVPASGQASAIIVQSAIGILAIAGALHIEARKSALLGEDWQRYAAQSSLIPFLAIVQGRQSFVFAEIGWWRLLGGAVLFAVLVSLHHKIIGVSPLPM